MLEYPIIMMERIMNGMNFFIPLFIFRIIPASITTNNTNPRMSRMLSYRVNPSIVRKLRLIVSAIILNVYFFAVACLFKLWLKPY
jgi:hypothetical protein